MEFIEGYEKMYSVDEEGNVYSHYSKKMLSQKLSRGYPQVQLYKDGRRKFHYVHRLVAKAFLNKEDGKSFVNHIDGDKLNNNAGNLEWCTQSENQKHAYELGLQKPNILKAQSISTKKSSIKVNQYAEDGKFINTYNSMSEAKNALDFSSVTMISECCRGLRETAKGFRWSYAT